MLFACLPSLHCGRLLRCSPTHIHYATGSVSGVYTQLQHDICIWFEKNPDNLNDKIKLTLLPVNFALNTENFGFPILTPAVINHFSELLGKISFAVWKEAYQFYG
ncbi:hypothetical protein D915_010715 [Fasciola hepatica]|uniref:Uncharacterized protein n=1 Tax=Fasciola hepatica TaxID=6192 RepID=A0A4E0QW42_FASHE|nr:hypothetical protein D915_010715 [Fasciola hepatica]